MFAQPLSRALSTDAGSCTLVRQDNRQGYAELVSRCACHPEGDLKVVTSGQAPAADR
jgi:hypothetical protein